MGSTCGLYHGLEYGLYHGLCYGLYRRPYYELFVYGGALLLARPWPPAWASLVTSTMGPMVESAVGSLTAHVMGYMVASTPRKAAGAKRNP